MDSNWEQCGRVVEHEAGKVEKRLTEGPDLELEWPCYDLSTGS